MYIQIFIPLQAALFLKEIQQSAIRINYKPNKRQDIVSQNKCFKQDKYFDEINRKSGNYCKWLMDKVLT